MKTQILLILLLLWSLPTLAHETDDASTTTDAGATTTDNWVNLPDQNPLKRPTITDDFGRHPQTIDIDADGDLDAFDGRYYYQNIGTKKEPKFKTPPILIIDQFFGGTESLASDIFFAEWKADFRFVDIDNDGDWDAFARTSPMMGTPPGPPIRYYENTGTPSTPVFEERTGTANPLADIRKGIENGDIDMWARLTFVDIDADQDLDIFFGYQSNRAIQYYKNTGNPNHPVFEQQTDSATNPLGKLDIPEKSGGIPSGISSFFDHDQDGDLDIFITNVNSMFYYENIGTANQPQFEQRSVNPLNSINDKQFLSIEFKDIDNDNDVDVFMGKRNLPLTYYENTGPTDNPQFVENEALFQEPNTVDVGAKAIISFVDIDNDGDQDVFIGRDSVASIVRYYENIGNARSPQFIKRTHTANPLHDINSSTQLVNLSSINFFDIDNDGDWDAFISQGKMRYYENTGHASSPQFVEVENVDNNPLEPLNELSAGKIIVVDIDYDGDIDMFATPLDHEAPIIYFENTGNLNTPVFVEYTGKNNPLDGVRGLFVSTNLNFGDMDQDGDWDAVFKEGNLFYYYENTGSYRSPLFEQRTDQNNPFLTLQQEGLSTYNDGAAPSFSFVDIDNDGYLEIFIGLEDGTVKYYKNLSQHTTNNPYVFKESHNNPFGPFSSTTPVRPSNFSQISFADLDNDHDWDAFITYISGKISYHENIGDSHNPHFIGEFPYNQKINVIDDQSILVDLDQDKSLEVIGYDKGKLLYYKNIGDAKQPYFEPSDINPFKDIDTSSVFQFNFVDIDNDQDLDLFLGQDNGIRYFENIGHSHLPIFEERLEAANPLSKETGNYPRLVDIDYDGDPDAFLVGIEDAQIRYFENIGSPNQPQFKEQTGTANPLVKLKLDSPVPAFVDLEQDGDWDVIMGQSDGTLSYYENTGTATTPQFVERVDHPLALINVGYDSKPYFADFEPDGDWDIFDGNHLKYYENTGNATQPVFQQSYFNPLGDITSSSLWARLNFVDIDNDTDQDLFVGYSDGTLNYHENIGDSNAPKFVKHTDKFTNLRGSTPTFVDIDNDQDLDALILSMNDNSHRYYENVGQIDQPQFVERFDTANPLDEFITRPLFSAQFLDGDSDQDLDIVLLSVLGFVYYENIGQADNPKFIKNTSNPFDELNKLPMLFEISLKDIDNDGDLDMFLADLFNISYYINTSAKGRTLADYYALPSGGKYGQDREINLGCLDCTHIYYTLDGSQPTVRSTPFTTPFNITKTTTLKFLTMDAQDNASDVTTEQYLIDTQSPALTITWPFNNQVLLDIGRIEGTVVDPKGGSKLERIELQINNGPLYLTGDNDDPFTKSPIWIKFLISTPSEQWFYDFERLQLPIGPYTITVRAYDFAGNSTEETLTVVKVEKAISDLFLELSSATLLNDATLNAKGTLVSKRFPPVPENLAGLPIELTITAPDGSTSTVTTQLLSDIGQYEFNEISDFSLEGAYTLQTRFAGNKLLTESVSSQQTVLVGESAGYAIIIQGRIKDGEGLDSHNKTTNRIYQILKKRGFEDANIFYFNPNPDQEGIEIDGPPTVADFVTIEEMQHRINGSPAPFYLIMVDHGDKQGNFYINDTELEAVTPEIWAGWLEALETGLNDLTKPRIIILGYCYSGKTLEAISKPGRIVISSATAKEESYKGPSEPDGVRSGEFFMEAFFKNLGRGESLYTAFEEASGKTKEFTTRTGRFVNVENEFGDDAVQHPLIEINGDQKGNNKAVLEYQVEEAKAPFNITEIFLGAGADYDTNYAGNPADIVSVAETIYLTPEESATTLSLTVNNQVHRIKEAAVNVRLPSTELTLPDADSTGYAEQREITELVEINLLCDFSQQCQRNTDEVTPNLFTEPGKYNLYYFVVDNETDNMSPIHHAVIYKGKADNQLPPSFTLLTPENHTKTPTTPTFTWQPTPDPDKDAITYTLSIAEDSDFNTIAYQQEGLRKPEYALEDETVLKDNTTYYWKVEAVDYFGGRVESGEVFSISTKAEQ